MQAEGIMQHESKYTTSAIKLFWELATPSFSEEMNEFVVGYYIYDLRAIPFCLTSLHPSSLHLPDFSKYNCV